MFIGLTLFTRVDVDQVSTLIISTRTSAALRYVNNLWMMLNITYSLVFSHLGIADLSSTDLTKED